MRAIKALGSIRPTTSSRGTNRSTESPIMSGAAAGWIFGQEAGAGAEVLQQGIAHWTAAFWLMAQTAALGISPLSRTVKVATAVKVRRIFMTKPSIAPVPGIRQ